MESTAFLQVNNLEKKIKNNVVLYDINLQLHKGKIYGFRGKNGSGKTMLFRAICGLIRPTNGTIIIDQKKLGEEISFPESVGVLIEYPGFLADLTGFKNLKMIAEINNQIGESEIKEMITKVGLDPEDKRKFKKYSLGMKQRLGIAQALMEEPELLILDEPLNALDSGGIDLVKNLLMEMREKNKLILIASHDKEALELLSDEIFTIENGKIVDHIVRTEI
ncbi:ATP-binding cassette domain-containing protein [Massilibacterium senegalense]|uniref:ATP-binding cassette domain-containing protein n=1 Tax=Massilibacterium senegalense TaxID=1632858 RepID=UPI000782179E|nr:ATP-binding cassette domain-containing protein [Massilibacterium senegalense]